MQRLRKKKCRRLIAGLLACTILAAWLPAATIFAQETSKNTANQQSAKQTEANKSAASANKENTANDKQNQSLSITTDKDGKTIISFSGIELSIPQGTDLSALQGLFNIEGTTSEKTESTAKTSYATVKKDCSSLNLRANAGKDKEVIGSLKPGEKVELIAEQNGWCKVKVSEKEGYVSKDYLDIEPSGEAGDLQTIISDVLEDPEKLMPWLLLFAEGFTDDSDHQGLSPEGNLTLIDDIGPTTEAGQQFITLASKDGNYFYLVIDRDDKGNENVHFLNLVDEEDLFALMEEDQAAAMKEQLAQKEEQKQEVEKPAETESTEVTAPTEAELEVPKPELSLQHRPSRRNLLLVAGAGILGLAGGVFFLITQSKKKKASATRPDPDADYEGYNDHQEEEDEIQIPKESEEEPEEEELDEDLEYLGEDE